jgi:hypothetical protein
MSKDFMNDESPIAKTLPAEDTQSLDRRLFLRSLGKWSGAAVVAAVAGTFWLASSPQASAGWVNRRGVVRGGGWINGGGWVNRAGGWINGGGGGGWVNRRGGGGGWINR